MRGGRQALGDDVLVQRAARRVAVQVAALVAAGMLLLVVLVSYVVVRGQVSAADALLRSTAATADDVGDPPPGAWLVFDRGGRVQSSPGLPEDLGPSLAALRRGASPTAPLRDLTGDDGEEYRVVTRPRAVGTVQVVLDLTTQHEERARLLRAMGLASGLALLFAAGVGVLLGRRAVRPLAQALALQRTFIADASHELRTPLTLLSTRAQLLDRSLQGTTADPAVLADAAGVVHDVQRLGEVVDDLRVAADPREQDAREPVDVAAVVAAVVASATAHATEAGVALSAEDDGAGRCWVTGSAPALRRAIVSLVDNAIDHTPDGGDVRVRIRRDRGDVVVAVSDTGPGIAPEAAHDVLRRFHSGGHRAGRAHYGLGLALTHDVANRHGGQLRLARGTVGATFELVLPARDGRLPDPHLPGS